MRTRTAPRPGPRLVAIYSTYGKLLGRAPLACLYAWGQASFAIGPDGQQYNKRRRGAPDDDYCWPLDPTDEPEGGDL